MGLKIQVSTERMAALTGLLQKFQNTPEIRAAMARGLNEHLERQKRDTVTTVAAQTGLSKGMIEGETSLRHASAAHLEGAVKMQGPAVLAGEHTSRRWSKSEAGAYHGDWPTYTRKGGLMEHTFMAYGHITRRKGKERGPLQAVWGPVPPNEMLRKDMPNWPRAEADVSHDLAPRVLRAVQFAMGF